MSYPFYIIRHHSEECTCSNCGCPLYVGDFVYTIHSMDITCCCPDCIEELLNYLDRTTSNLINQMADQSN